MTGLRWGGIALGWVVAVLWATRTARVAARHVAVAGSAWSRRQRRCAGR